MATVCLHGPMAESVREKATRLSDGQRLAIRIAGIVITLTAIALIAFVFSRFLSLFTTGGPPPDEFTQQIPLMFGLFALGGVCMLIGTFLLRLGFLRPFSEIVATEAEGALHSAGGSLGRGWRGDKQPQQSSEIRIRCRECGGLEDERAKFCSSCGEAL